MISRQVANISSVVEVFINILITAIVAHTNSTTVEHTLGIDWIHVLVVLIHWWLSATQEVVVDLLVWINAIVLLWDLFKLCWLSNWSFLLSKVNVIRLCLRRLLSWYLSWWLLIGWYVVHLFSGSGAFVLISWWLVIVIFSVHFDSKLKC